MAVKSLCMTLNSAGLWLVFMTFRLFLVSLSQGRSALSPSYLAPTVPLYSPPWSLMLRPYDLDVSLHISNSLLLECTYRTAAYC